VLLMTVANQEETQVELCTVSQGAISMSVIGSGAAKRLSEALERADPWGSIPFVKRRSCDRLEALEAIQAMGVLNTLRLIKLLGGSEDE